MKICFIGTSIFASIILQRIIQAEFKIHCVYTKNPKKSNRGHKIHHTPVYQISIEQHLLIHCLDNFKNGEDKQNFINEKFDIAIVASYGALIPKELLEVPKFGFINIHASLLPRWRGASPIQQSILNGDTKTGITIMYMDKGLDTGDIIYQKSTNIKQDTTFQILHDELANIGADMIIHTLNTLQAHKPLPRLPQDSSYTTYAGILNKDDGGLDFNHSATDIDRQIRALNPYPTTFVYHKNQRIKILKALPVNNKKHDFALGSIVSINPLIIAAKDSLLQILQLQKSGKKPLQAEDFIRGSDMVIGDILTATTNSH